MSHNAMSMPLIAATVIPRRPTVDVRAGDHPEHRADDQALEREDPRRVAVGEPRERVVVHDVGENEQGNHAGECDRELDFLL